MADGKKWIQKAHIKKGALHEALHIPEGKKIPAGALVMKPGDSPLMKKRKALARTMRGFKK